MKWSGIWLISDMQRILIFSIIVCIISVIIKRNCLELYIPFQIGTAIIVAVYILNQTFSELEVFFSLVESMGANFEIIKAMLKAAFITVGTKLGCDVCKESGNHLIGDIIELGGKIMIFVIAIPYIISIVKISAAFLK